MITRALIGISFLLFAGCGQSATSARTAEDAVQITNRSRAENFPSAGPARVSTQDLGDRWWVTYVRLEGGTGGVATYEVDKASGNILSEGSGQ